MSAAKTTEQQPTRTALTYTIVTVSFKPSLADRRAHEDTLRKHGFEYNEVARCWWRKAAADAPPVEIASFRQLVIGADDNEIAMLHKRKPEFLVCRAWLQPGCWDGTELEEHVGKYHWSFRLWREKP